MLWREPFEIPRSTVDLRGQNYPSVQNHIGLLSRKAAHWGIAVGPKAASGSRGFAMISAVSIMKPWAPQMMPVTLTTSLRFRSRKHRLRLAMYLPARRGKLLVTLFRPTVLSLLQTPSPLI